MGDVDDESADDADSGEEEEDKEWVWEAEDDYTVGHVWETGTEEDKGVIYVRPDRSFYPSASPLTHPFAHSTTSPACPSTSR